MFQIHGKSRQERLADAVQKLAFRFPVAEIVEKTNFAKSIVSRNLSAEEPSKDFLRTFYKAFHLSFEELWDGVREGVIEPQPEYKKESGYNEPDYKAKYLALKAVVLELLRGNVSSDDVLETLAVDPASPGQSTPPGDDLEPGIRRTYKGKKGK